MYGHILLDGLFTYTVWMGWQRNVDVFQELGRTGFCFQEFFEQVLIHSYILLLRMWGNKTIHEVFK